VPELPEVQALVDGLAAHLTGRTVTACRLNSFSALKTVEPPLEALTGSTVVGAERRGKYVCLHTSTAWLVVHLSRAGWIRWFPEVPTTRLKPGRSPIALRLGFDDGSGIDVTEMGTEKRLALWVVTDPAEVEGVATLGIDPLGAEFTVERFGELLAGSSATLKTLLADQRIVAGIGNAYSDEALHVARLSPYKRASSLDAEGVATLHAAVVGVLTEAAARAAGSELTELKGDKKRSMRVHGRTGEPCPECGDTVRQVAFATSSLQYCPTCQTGGRPLADRRLSKLLK
jgi:formamidopyrimidine-DNA glycosylase